MKPQVNLGAMTSVFPPAPWKWIEGSDGWDGQTVHLADAEDSVILMGWGYDASGISFGSKAGATGNDVDDARTLPAALLIAAAPELYNALKAMREAYVGVEDMLIGDSMKAKVAAMDAAIAKAEGRS